MNTPKNPLPFQLCIRSNSLDEFLLGHIRRHRQYRLPHRLHPDQIDPVFNGKWHQVALFRCQRNQVGSLDDGIVVQIDSEALADDAADVSSISEKPGNSTLSGFTMSPR